MKMRAELLLLALLTIVMLVPGATPAQANSSPATLTAGILLSLGLEVGPTFSPIATSIAPATGACTFRNATCQILAPSRCAALGGIFLGVSVACKGTGGTPGVVTGACTFRNASCRILEEARCALLRGVYLGDGTVCKPTPPARVGP